MTVNYWILPVALLLLWLPRQWLRFGGKVIKAPSKRSADNSGRGRGLAVRIQDEVRKPRNWIDLLRAAVGAIAVIHVCFEPAPDAARSVGLQIFVIESLILVVAVLIQTIRIEGKLALTAPIFFLLGLSFGIIGWKAAVFAFVTIWVINLVLPSASMFLFMFAGLQVGFGLLLSRISIREAALAASLSILPVLFSAILKRQLVRLNKKTRTVRS